MVSVRLALFRVRMVARVLAERAGDAVARRLNPARGDDLRAAASVLRVVAEAARRGFPRFWDEELELRLREVGGPDRLDDVADQLETEARFDSALPGRPH